jgi:hypothetical protein
MMAKKPKTFPSPEELDRHEKVQRALLDRIAYHERRAAERAEQAKQSPPKL